MTGRCEFPGCENTTDGTAYCDECHSHVLHRQQPPDVGPVWFFIAILVTIGSVALVVVFMLVSTGVW